MGTQEVKDYLVQLPSFRTLAFDALTDPDKDKAIFSATENLNDYFGESKVTARAVALQVLFEVEAENEEYAKLKRQGVNNAQYSDTRVQFADASFIAPQVMALLGTTATTSSGSIGRLV